MREALGLIETVGLAAAYEAADTALKTANVELIGYELSKGDGMVTVKIKGKVGAVEAGVKSAKVAAGLVSKVFSTRVIPRPSDHLEKLVFTEETVNYEKKIVDHQKDTVAVVKEEIDELNHLIEEVTEDKVTQAVVKDTEPVQMSLQVDDVEEVTEEVQDNSDKKEESKEVTCNMCGDPECTRKKGQPKRYCKLYFNTIKEKKNG